MINRFKVGDLVELKQIILPELPFEGCRVGMVADFDKIIGRRTRKYLIHWVPSNEQSWHYPSELSRLNRKEGNV